MFDKKGMILIESLLFFSIIVVLVLVLLQCANVWNTMAQIEEKGVDNEKIREIYQP